jgi:hypothetical protein
MGIYDKSTKTLTKQAWKKSKTTTTTKYYTTTDG